MPEYLLIIIVGLACALAGYLAGRRLPARPGTAPLSEPAGKNERPAEELPGSRQREVLRPEGEQYPSADGEAENRPEPPLPGPCLSPAAAEDGTGAERAVTTARQVLEVADRIGNQELARRLVEAVVLLPGVGAIRPEPGDGYQPRLHEWAGHEITDEPAQWNTIARTLAPGAITTGRALLRPAKVIVFEPTEQS